jgi:hypothetical protein
MAEINTEQATREMKHWEFAVSRKGAKGGRKVAKKTDENWWEMDRRIAGEALVLA